MSTDRFEEQACAQSHLDCEAWKLPGTDGLSAPLPMAAGPEAAFALGRQTGRAEERQRIRDAYDNPEQVIGPRRAHQAMTAWRLHAVFKILDGGQ